MTNSYSFIKQDSPPKPPLIIYYQTLVAIAAILVFFTRSDVYLSREQGIGIPLYWLLGFLALSFPLFLSLIRRSQAISKSIILWILGYLGFAFLLIIIHPQLPALQYLEDKYRSIIFLITMLAIFAYHPFVTKWIKRTVLAITIMNVFMFIYEFFNPMAFYIEQRAPGRSAGVYQDSNTAGIALVMGMIFTIDMVKPKYRLLYTLFIFLGLAFTFSRGTIAGWVIIMGIYLAIKTIPRYQFPLLLGFFLVITTILAAQLNSLSYLKNADGDSLFQEGTIARVEFLINPFSQKDDSKDSRLSHVEFAWQKFAESPVIGGGLGAGENDSTISQVGKAQRSHNTYLDIMVEFGFLGALIYPGLLVASIWAAEGEFKKQGIAFVIFMMIQGIFSHTLISEFCSLIAYTIMANLSMHSSVQNSKLNNTSMQNSSLPPGIYPTKP